jgi:hypothetical protein
MPTVTKVPKRPRLTDEITTLRDSRIWSLMLRTLIILSILGVRDRDHVRRTNFRQMRTVFDVKAIAFVGYCDCRASIPAVAA